MDNEPLSDDDLSEIDRCLSNKRVLPNRYTVRLLAEARRSRTKPPAPDRPTREAVRRELQVQLINTAGGQWWKGEPDWVALPEGFRGRRLNIGELADAILALFQIEASNHAENLL